MGVATRATGTAFVLLLFMRIQGISLALPRELRAKALLSGVLIALQSYCLYSAVAIIPVALALLVFQSSAPLYVLLSWALGKHAPHRMTLPAMLLALVGLALALDVQLDHVAGRWSEIGTGVLWALGSAASMTLVYYMNANALKAVDGKLRTFVMTGVTAVLVIAGAAAADALVLPRDATGYVGLAFLTFFYCIAMSVLFVVLPRVETSTSVALSFEPIALLGLAWVFLGQAVKPLQILGAVLTVGAIAWLGTAKR